MQFPNPTRLSKMTEPELQREIEYRMDGMWEKPENRIRIDDCYRELNRREVQVHRIQYETTKIRLGQTKGPAVTRNQQQGR